MSLVHEDKERPARTGTALAGYHMLTPQDLQQALRERLRVLELEHYQQGVLMEEASSIGGDTTQYATARRELDRRISIIDKRLASVERG